MTAVLKALAAWAGAPPDWVRLLAEECDRTSQSAAARRIGVAVSAVNMALANKYRIASASALPDKVRIALVTASISCPASGYTITERQCRTQRDAPWSGASAERARQFRACRGCERGKA